MAAAFVYPNVDPAPYLRRTAAIAHALDLGLEVVPAPGVDRNALERIARDLGGEMLHDTVDPARVPGDTLRASLVALPHGKIAAKLANTPLPYDLFIVGAGSDVSRRKSGALAVFAHGRGSAAHRLRQAHRLHRRRRGRRQDLRDARPRPPAQGRRRRRRRRFRGDARAERDGRAARRAWRSFRPRSLQPTESCTRNSIATR